jgi:hypothetical protein
MNTTTTTTNTTTTTTPQVGMGATLCCYSDRMAFTIVKVSPKSFIMQRDKAILLNGGNSGEPDALQFSPGGFAGHVSGTQRYRYERNPDGETMRVSLRKDGVYRVSETDARVVKVGVRAEYYDFNF